MVSQNKRTLRISANERPGSRRRARTKHHRLTRPRRAWFGPRRPHSSRRATRRLRGVASPQRIPGERAQGAAAHGPHRVRALRGGEPPVVGTKTNANLAYDDFLVGHARWFEGALGSALLDRLHRRAHRG